jgi:hypothetical protein
MEVRGGQEVQRAHTAWGLWQGFEGSRLLATVVGTPLRAVCRVDAKDGCKLTTN